MSIASGDIRNVVQTVNALPEDYSGHLTIMLNDLDGIVVGRNLLLLAVLGSIDDHSQAAEIALHLWYSAFLRQTHVAILSRIIWDMLHQMVEGDSFTLKLWEQHLTADAVHFKLGEHSLLKSALSRIPEIVDPSIPNGSLYCAQMHLMDFHKFNLEVKGDDMESARQQALKSMRDVRYDSCCIDHVLFDLSSINRQKRRFNSSRADYHDRQSCYLEEPSHRLANLKFRKSGIVLPFGAADGDFNIPNRTIFSSDGKWLSEDSADPLGSWK